MSLEALKETRCWEADTCTLDRKCEFFHLYCRQADEELLAEMEDR